MPIPGTEPPRLRPALDADAAGLILLIGGCYAEYPGCILDVDGESPELRGIATAAAGWDGRFWVAEQAGRIVGSIGFQPAEGGALEILKLYVAAPARRQGLAARLLALVETEAERRGADTLTLWTDTRFVDAHRFYDRHGFVRSPGERVCDDLSVSREYQYRRTRQRAAA